MGLKVLICTPFFPPIVNGTSLYVYNLVKGLEAYQISVRVHTIGGGFSKSIYGMGLKHGDFDVVSFRNILDGSSFSSDQPFASSYIASTIKACDDFDLVHVHDSPKICNDILILALRKLKSGKPLIFTPHGGLVSLPAYERASVKSSFYKFFSKWYWSSGTPKRVLQSADRIVAVSHVQAKIFVKILHNDRKVIVIPEAVPYQYFVENPTFVDDHKLKILFVGRLAEDKGIRNLLYAMREILEVCQAENVVQLVCIGPDYGYLNEALKIVDHLRLNEVVKILGPLPEREKIKYYGWCDLLVLPSYYEAFGIPIVEAMAHGKAVVATDTIGARSLVKHGETGFLLDKRDAHSIAQAFVEFLKNPELKYQMGQNALKNASKFHMKDMIEEHLRVYKELVNLQN